MVAPTGPDEHPAPEYSTARFAGEGAFAGVLAGLILMACQALLAYWLEAPAWTPLATTATIALGNRALAMGPNPAVLAVGLIIHLALSAIFGAIWGLWTRRFSAETRDSGFANGMLAAFYGLGLYILNYVILGALFFHTFISVNPFAAIPLNMAAYGLPLGRILASRLRRRVDVPHPELRMPLREAEAHR